MKRLIVKPTVEALLWYKATDKTNIPYQWVNWWLYQKGEDQLIKHYNDIEHPLYNTILINQSGVIEDPLRMVGGADKSQEKLERLLQQKDIGAEYEQALLKNLDDLYEEWLCLKYVHCVRKVCWLRHKKMVCYSQFVQLVNPKSPMLSRRRRIKSILPVVLCGRISERKKTSSRKPDRNRTS